MPEFILDHGTPEAAHKFNELDSFTQGYIEAAFFTSTGYPENEDLENTSVAELATKTLDKMKFDCARFQTLPDVAVLLAAAYETGYEEIQAGRDFWFTRNGHGVGFWDRNLPDDLGEKLSAQCRYNEVDLYRGDDGLIYLA